MSGDSLRGEAPVTVALRCARWLLAMALRCWPAETRAWGLALAAEVGEASHGFEALWWSLGGLMFFARTVLASAWKWMKLPAGSSLSAGLEGKNPSMHPKRSRLFTSAMLAVTALLVCVWPQGREAFRTVSASWLGFRLTGSDERTLKKLVARAVQENDAEMLAFVALGPTESETTASDLVERAVALDPSFIWIYGAKTYRAGYNPAQKERLERLRAADPYNAVPILLEANALAEEDLSSANGPGHPDEKDYRDLGKDPRWMALMARAFAAPRYDSYFIKHFRLMRAVWERDPDLPPEIVSRGVWSNGIPDQHLLQAYAGMEMDEAKKAEAAGDVADAEKAASQVATFGERMLASDGSSIEQLVGTNISAGAEANLVEIYTRAGKSAEARAATARLNRIVPRVFPYPDRIPRIKGLQNRALAVQAFAVLGLLAGLLSVAGVLVLEVWPWKDTLRRRILCFATDWAPGTLLAASGAAVLCFLPFRQAFAEFRMSTFASADEVRLTDALWSLRPNPGYLYRMDAAVEFWSAVTYALSAIVVCMVAWAVYRSSRARTKPALTVT